MQLSQTASKSPLSSVTIAGGTLTTLAALVALAARLLDVEIQPQEVIDLYALAATFVGGIIAIIGRFRARVVVTTDPAKLLV